MTLLDIGKGVTTTADNMLHAMTNQGEQLTTTWQVVDVSRPLMSVHQICQHGNVVVFGAEGGYVMNLANGSQTFFGVEDSVYVMDLYLPPDPASPQGFRRQGAHP